MSYISEKVSYLNGLADGMQLEDNSTGKLLRGVLDTLSAIAETLEEHDDSLTDLSDCVEDIYEELDELDPIDEDDDDFDDDDFVEITCPNCGETVYFDIDMIDSEDGLICPNCNEPIEIDFECHCDECEGCEDDDK